VCANLYPIPTALFYLHGRGGPRFASEPEVTQEQGKGLHAPVPLSLALLQLPSRLDRARCFLKARGWEVPEGDPSTCASLADICHNGLEKSHFYSLLVWDWLKTHENPHKT